MYSRALADAALARVLASPLGKAYPAGVERLPVDTCRSYVRRLAEAYDPKRGPTRALSSDEQVFVQNERLLAKLDYQYWAERYAVIIHPAKGVSPMFPLWESQTLILSQLAEQQEQRAASGHPDGLIFNVLKGRQLGCSTLCQSIIAHRITTQSYTKAMIASDVPENSGSTGLFGMLELTVEHLPWWLTPGERFHQKDAHIVFANHSSVVVESGKSMKGGKQDDGGQKGQIGRSKTYSMVHLSELSTWENPHTIDDSLSPAVAQTPRTFWAKESTAKGRHNWWHEEWQATERGVGRSFNIFIPWYAERSKYWLPVPEGWEPPGYCLEYAERVARHAPRWMRRAFQLSAEQLYWYYSMREAAEEKGVLYKFLEEYPAEPEEAFQYSGRSIFTPAELDRLRNHAREPRQLYLVQPNTLIASLRDERFQEREAAVAIAQARRADIRHGAEPVAVEDPDE